MGNEIICTFVFEIMIKKRKRKYKTQGSTSSWKREKNETVKGQRARGAGWWSYFYLSDRYLTFTYSVLYVVHSDQILNYKSKEIFQITSFTKIQNQLI